RRTAARSCRRRPCPCRSACFQYGSHLRPVLSEGRRTGAVRGLSRAAEVRGGEVASEGLEQVSAQLGAVVAADEEGRRRVLTTNVAKSLPAGPLQREHRSMQEGMRAWVTQQTGCRLGFIEQLYTFADRDRGSGPAIEVSYLGLSAITGDARRWPGWYDFFPWEDRRESAEMIEAAIAPELEAWSRRAPG